MEPYSPYNLEDLHGTSPPISVYERLATNLALEKWFLGLINRSLPVLCVCPSSDLRQQPQDGDVEKEKDENRVPSMTRLALTWCSGSSSHAAAVSSSLAEKTACPASFLIIFQVMPNIWNTKLTQQAFLQ